MGRGYWRRTVESRVRPLWPLPAGRDDTVGGRWPRQQQMARSGSGGRTRTCRALDTGSRSWTHEWTTTARIARVELPASGVAGSTLRPFRSGPWDACATGSARTNGRVAQSAVSIYGDRPPPVGCPRYRRPMSYDRAGLQPNPESPRAIYPALPRPASEPARGCAVGPIVGTRLSHFEGLCLPVRPVRSPVCTAFGSGRRQIENAPPG